MSRRRVQLFEESPLTPAQQVDFLASKGLRIDDPERARKHLEHINYHRLRPYWDAFQNGSDQRFLPGTTFDDVLKRYTFDRKLRLLILDATERVEVSLRSRWSNQMSLRHGPLCLGQESLFVDRQVYRRSFDSLLHFYRQNDDEFVAYFRHKYPRVSVPPIWICSEMLSLGQLCRWLGNLQDPRDIRDLGEVYGLDSASLLGFLAHLTEVRNMAAHHSRIWNRQFPPFPFPRQRPGPLEFLDGHVQGRLYNTVLMLDYLLAIVSPGNSWIPRLLHSLKRHQDAATDMGFPPDWRPYGRD